MSDLDFLIPESIPVWELAIIAVAALAMLLVFILWYFLGYNLVVAPSQPDMINPVASLML